MPFSKCLTLAVILLSLLAGADAESPPSPPVWNQPGSFVPQMPHLGLPPPGASLDGHTWIFGSNRVRTSMFLTLSRDGITFDRTWSLLHQRVQVTEGVSKPAYGGPPNTSKH